MAGWLKIGKGAEHGGVSRDTFNTWPALGLRFVRLPSGTRLFKEEWIDQFLESYEVVNDSQNEIDEIVNETIDGLMNDQKKGARDGHKA